MIQFSLQRFKKKKKKHHFAIVEDKLLHSAVTADELLIVFCMLALNSNLNKSSKTFLCFISQTCCHLSYQENKQADQNSWKNDDY